MIIKVRHKEYYTAPEKRKKSPLKIALLIVAAIVLFVLGYFSANPVLHMLGLV